MPVTILEKNPNNQNPKKPTKKRAVLNFYLPPQWNDMPFPTISNLPSFRSLRSLIVVFLEEKLGISKVPSRCIAFYKDWPYLSYF